MKRFFALLTIALLFAPRLYAQENPKAAEEKLSAERYQALSDELKNPQQEITKALLNQFVADSDYGKRREIVDEFLYTFAGAGNIAPDSRKPTSLRYNPMDARQLAVIEFFNASPYHNKHWEHDEPQNPRPVAASYLKQAYRSVADYVYQILRLNDPDLLKIMSGITLTYQLDKHNWIVDVAPAVDILEQPQDFTENAVLRQDFETCIKRYSFLPDYVIGAFHQYAQTVPNSPRYEWYLHFGENKPLITFGDDEIKGTAGDDRINGYAGNDKINGQDGNDILIGGEGNDYLEGGNGDDQYLFAPGWGKDEINNCTAAPNDKDIIHFEAGIEPEDLRVFRRENNLLIQQGNTENQIIIRDYFLQDKCKVSEIQFADEASWDQKKILGRYSRVEYVFYQLKNKAAAFWDWLGSFTSDLFYKLIVALN